MDVIATVVSTAVVTALGLILAWFGKGQFEALGHRIERLEERLDRRMDGMQTSIDTMRSDLTQSIDGVRSDLTQMIDGVRSDLTQVALAVGVRPRATNA